MRSTGLTAFCVVALSAVLGGCTTAPAPPAPATVPLAPPSTTGPPAPPSATTTAPPVTTQQPSGTPVVVLDAGHNGGNAGHPSAINRQVPDGRGGTKACNTTGTATDAGYPEHAFAFDVTARVTSRLTAAGVRVVPTRTDDDGVGPCVDVRGRAGEAARAAR